MSNNISIKKWERYFKSRGLSGRVISQYIPYIRKLRESNAPVIFEFEHLSKMIGIKRAELAKIVNSTEHYYRTFYIPKRKGGKREICSPYPSLLHCQKWIYKNILLQQSIHNSAHGFVPGRSIFTNATPHLKQRALLKMDIENFFPSIPINWVINYFSSLGYAKNVTFYLASICCLNGCLAQGAATSPYLTNTLMQSLDNRMAILSEKYQLIYTRYADDLTFSGNYIPHGYIKIVTNIIENYGLVVNREKTRLHIKPGQRIVTGLSVAGEVLKLPRSTKRHLRKEIFYLRKYGYLSHISKMKINNPFYIDSIEGKIQFWLQTEPDNSYAIQSLSYIGELKRALDS